jgi:arylsulfatase A-like enzyme
MVDNIGYADLSSYGRTDYQTPAIDGLIAQGMRFNQAYAASPVCTPTRVGLMTGQYPARNKIGLREPLTYRSDSLLGLSPTKSMLSSLLKKSGYETALFGKWHLGAVPDFSPNKHDFNHFWGITAGHADYIDHKYYDDRHLLFDNEKPIDKEGYLTDLITEKTVEFISQEHSRPFFVSLQYSAPHWPWQVPGDDPYPLAESVSGFVAGGTREVYAGMMTNLDNNIGLVLQAIKDAGLSKSTVIIFTDDGGSTKFSDMGPLHGGGLYEGEIRVPASVCWPEKIKAGTVSEQPVITMDWTVTMLSLAKAEMPSDVVFDGMNLIPHLTENAPVIPRTLYWRTSNYSKQDAFRSGDWKYLKSADVKEQLFNIVVDPGESNDLKETEPEKFRELKEGFQKLDSEMLDRLILE